MNLIFTDETKIKTFAKIQESLSSLETNSGNEAIELIIDGIPKSYLDQKDDLMVLCCIFGYYGRNNIKNRIGDTVKLFKKIMEPIKKHLQDESSFFWKIFGNIFYLKRWMYEEGLISLEYIIQRSLHDERLISLESISTVTQYFLPEIYEKEPVIFEKEFKNKFQIDFKFLEEKINEFIELRNKHFKWLCESNDFNDPFYQEIEKNQLRLAIKRDDIDSFQSIISNSNIPLDSKIQESLLENTYLNLREISLIDFAIDFNAVKIVKYLLMNGAKIGSQSVFNSICNRDYELIHIVESQNVERFEKYCLADAIQCWNFEVAKYSIENYAYDFLENEDIEPEKYNMVVNLLFFTFYSVNFQFYDQIFLPFLKKNPIFVKNEIHNIIAKTIIDKSCFFMKEFLKYPEININYLFEDKETNEVNTFLSVAIKESNNKAVEILLNNPKVNIKKQRNDDISPFMLAIIIHSDLKMLDMFINHPKFDVYQLDDLFKNPFYELSFGLLDNFYAIDHLLKKFPDYFNPIAPRLIIECCENYEPMSIKILLKHLLINNKDKSGEEVIKELEIKYQLDDDIVYKLLDIWYELSLSFQNMKKKKLSDVFKQHSSIFESLIIIFVCILLILIIGKWF